MTFQPSAAAAGGTVAFGPPAGDVTVGGATTDGTSGYVNHADHAHAFPAAPAGEGAAASKPGDLEADGSSTNASRSDHVHAREDWGTAAELAPLAFAADGTPGTSGAVADAAHTHGFAGYATTTTAPAAGSAGALPSAPAGYLAVTIAGANHYLPYY